MEKFEIPVSGGNVDDSNSKELVISSYQGNLVRAPYEGVIDKMDPNHCGGYIKIQHNVNGQQYYSSLLIHNLDENYLNVKLFLHS